MFGEFQDWRGPIKEHSLHLVFRTLRLAYPFSPYFPELYYIFHLSVGMF